MSDERWRGPDAQRLSYRDFMRDHMPSGRDGLVIVDLDLVTRHHGALFSTDRAGILTCMEFKHDGYDMTWGQKWTFGPIDAALRTQMADRYRGFYLVQYEDEPFEVTSINYRPSDNDEFLKWMRLEVELAPYVFPARR